MKYDNIRRAVFLSRPNRFVARVMIDGREELCHVKNTGRCRELLLPGREIYVAGTGRPGRKTVWDLISVRKGERLINMDSAAPNKAFGEFLASGGMGFVPELIRPETVYGSSRFDFYLEHGGKRAFAEVKGVTLEEDGVVRFPDAPTERGLKHLRELARCAGEGIESYAVFVIQMKDVRYFEANVERHPEFARALDQAAAAGVVLLAYDCRVEPESLEISSPVPIRLRAGAETV